MSTGRLSHRVQAAEDPALHARIVRRVAMRYESGADAAHDRPAHVRAASGLAWIGERLAVIQDDASFLALVNPDTGIADAYPLPTGTDGVRQFDDSRGNKREKLDLEALALIPGPGAPMLAAFGSGSLPRREAVVLIAFEGDAPRIVVYTAATFYAQLRAVREFAGSEMNIEGALHVGEALTLFGRGNGAAFGEVRPVNASCEVRWRDVVAHLEHPERTPPPTPRQVTAYDLGSMEYVALGFTDVAKGQRGAAMFAAAAEASPDATRDGNVVGSVIGIIEPASDAARWTALLEENGRRFQGKVEGITLSRTSDHRVYAVVDSDDHTRASDMLEVELAGPW